ncbi:MAG: hypothetical protein KZQ83_00580 [gamma proteobacterium symbiont of Taylorina sp.]|nr:hypothetical protein [gamma proteobacterium symbiont of Taylorina sp.]
MKLSLSQIVPHLFGLSAFIRIAVNGFLVELGLAILNTFSIIDGSCDGYFADTHRSFIHITD